MPPRRDGVPVITSPSGGAEQLERVPLNERRISEGFLQDLLFNNPEVLPIDEIDPGFGPLIPIGREIGTAAGPMDNLYISPQGLLTLVEAKLWRNPEARRQVVGQILDYAKEISLWSYDDLNAKAREVARKSLWEMVSSVADDALEEPRFVDAVSRNMQAGRFLLLIVGDGIREEMERLADFLQATPQLRFTLGLIELQIYRMGNEGRLLVMPNVVGRTIEMTRAVIRVASTEGARVDVSLDVSDPDDGGGGGSRRRILTRDEFFDELEHSGTSPDGVTIARRIYEDFDDDDRFQIDWGSSSYSVKLRDPTERNQLYTILVVEQVGRAYVGWLDGQLSRVGLPVKLGRDFVASAGTLVKREVHPKYLTSWDRPAPLDDIVPNYGELKTLVEEFAQEVYSHRQA